MRILFLITFFCALTLNTSSHPDFARQEAENACFSRFVTNLPEIESVEIMSLASFDKEELKSLKRDDPRREQMYGEPIKYVRIEKLTGEKANQLRGLWQNLKPGTALGCFSPYYTIKFYFKDGSSFKSIVSFNCYNIILECGLTRNISGNFDAFRKFKAFIMETVPFEMAKDKKR